MSKYLSLAMAGAAMAFVAGTADAAVTLKATSITTVYSNAPTADLHKTNNPTKTDNDVSVSPQMLKGTLFSGGGAPGVPVEFFAYCVDIFQTSAPTTFNVVSLQDYLGGNATKTNEIAALIAAEGTQGGRTHDAAVQLAVWEIVNETLPTLDVNKYTETTTEYYYDSHHHLKSRQVTTTPDQFWVDGVKNGSGILAQSDNFLDAAVANAGNSTAGYSFYVAQSNSKQDLLFWTYTPPVTPAVPEPASWAMMLFGLGTVGYAMRAKRRTAVSFA